MMSCGVEDVEQGRSVKEDAKFSDVKEEKDKCKGEKR